MTERDTRTIEIPVWAAKALDMIFDQDTDEDRMHQSMINGYVSRDEVDATVLVRERIAELEDAR